jgi:hypothetical protein
MGRRTFRFGNISITPPALVGILLFIVLIIVVIVININNNNNSGNTPGTPRTFAALGIDNKIYTSDSLYKISSWAPNVGICTGICLIQLYDKTFACIGTDNRIYTSPTIINATWTPVKTKNNTPLFTSLVQINDLTFAASTNTDCGFIYVSSTLDDDDTSQTSKWVQQPQTGCVKWLLQLHDGTYACLPADTSNNIYTSPDISPSTTPTASVWTRTANGPTSSGISLSQLSDRTLLCIGSDNKRYTTTSTSLTGPVTWTKIDDTGMNNFICVIELMN